ncbi:hypothetical protein FIU82_11670 [Pseudoalteromonas sp. THAF3]|uniref:BPSS1780 family membrane protein n=1 Tax=unclassified Pseudoalteromonas TaxID=194690 RepID=UPI0006B42350|nr:MULTISPECIES: BPSS1780 family membrane protein [unclassified Pseudoalteromonas]MCG7567769.1 DUF2189 domain-containing protein [Pseudoalteromonas sp. CnMc7-15]QFU05646.1 hypothetical protein FIU82_11670 [Pseudoalteromonas sp. THAF3]RZF77206.1 DUF2189 domain-containing protein [Pseudoalteromonas sp. CO325X]GAP75466.1 putative membrane protein [Pseudoalteromonas sp. SW0106-04]
MAIEIRVHSAKAGGRWIKQGLDIFAKQPFTFMFMYLLIAVLGLVGLVVPLLKIPAALATPFLMAGFYQSALARQQGKNVAFADIIDVFSQKGRRMGLFRVGLYQMGAGILLGLLASVLFADMAAVVSDPNMNPEQALQLLAQSLSFPSLALFLVITSIYLCAFAFAIPLVFFGGHTSMWAVMKASLMAFYHNAAAMTVYGLIMGVLMLLCAVLSFIPLLVLMPICYISLLVAFQAIFAPQLGEQDAPTAQHVNAISDTTDNGRFDA